MLTALADWYRNQHKPPPGCAIEAANNHSANELER
jgi:hypothetical protein